MALRVCSIISPHSHAKGAEGGTVIVHNADALQDPGDDGEEEIADDEE